VRLLKLTKERNRDPFRHRESIALDEPEAEALLQYMQEQEALKEVGLGSPYVLARGETAPPELVRAVIQAISDEGLEPEELVSLQPLSQHLAYRRALAELRALVEAGEPESTYQGWFESHPWVFGTNYLGPADQRTVGLHDQVDILLRTADGYLDIFELKTPSELVLRYDRSRRAYCWTAEASQAVGQCAKYLRTVEDNRRELEMEEGLPFLKPRARIVMGRSNQWAPQHHDALRALNAALHFIEIWTYDYVLAMAQRLVDCYERQPGESGPEVGAGDREVFGDL
jgi:hypothetical protein